MSFNDKWMKEIQCFEQNDKWFHFPGFKEWCKTNGISPDDRNASRNYQTACNHSAQFWNTPQEKEKRRNEFLGQLRQRIEAEEKKRKQQEEQQFKIQFENFQNQIRQQQQQIQQQQNQNCQIKIQIQQQQNENQRLRNEVEQLRQQLKGYTNSSIDSKSS